MINANYYIAISGRVLSTPRRYFTGFLVDLETDKHRYDMVVKERREIETSSTETVHLRGLFSRSATVF